MELNTLAYLHPSSTSAVADTNVWTIARRYTLLGRRLRNTISIL